MQEEKHMQELQLGFTCAEEQRHSGLSHNLRWVRGINSGNSGDVQLRRSRCRRVNLQWPTHAIGTTQRNRDRDEHKTGLLLNLTALHVQKMSIQTLAAVAEGRDVGVGVEK